ncbi:MAG: hypothetical protein IPN47_21595 [Gemmatimonadetes bacterium]|nr:hypothetical protein [Gemmatimonadota bacterium]
MLHLPIERLAELVDGGATPAEREHLLVCVSCARELEAYRRLVVMAGDEHRRIAPPLTDWDSLGSRLRAEGLVTSGVEAATGAAPVRRRPNPVLEVMRRAAAVVVLVGGGAVLGRMTTGMPVVDAVAFRPNAPMQGDLAASPGAAPTTLAGNSGEGFATSQEALASLDLAQRQYEQAATGWRRTTRAPRSSPRSNIVRASPRWTAPRRRCRRPCAMRRPTRTSTSTTWRR